MVKKTKTKIPVWIDYREKKPYSFDCSKFDCENSKTVLKTGDYSIRGFEKSFSIERKSVSDFVQTISNTERRERFFKEVKRLSSMEMNAIIVEGTLDDIRDEVHSLQAMSAESMVGFVVYFSTRKDLNFILAGSRQWATVLTEKIMSKFWEKQKSKKDEK